MAFDFFNDWWKKKMAPQMVSTEGKNPAYTYTQLTETSRPPIPQADPYMMPGKVDAMKQRWEAGELDIPETWEKALDREWLAAAFASAIPGKRDLPSPPRAPSGAGQPRPGDFETIFSMGKKRKRKSLEEIGRMG